MGGGMGGFGSSGGSGFGDVFGDIFSEFFGSSGGTSNGRNERGSDLQYNLEVSFNDAAFGSSKEIDVPRMEVCDSCSGLGAESEKDINFCGSCGGTGQQRVQQGFFSVASTCGSCGGRGKTISKPCKAITFEPEEYPINRLSYKKNLLGSWTNSSEANKIEKNVKYKIKVLIDFITFNLDKYID